MNNSIMFWLLLLLPIVAFAFGIAVGFLFKQYQVEKLRRENIS